MNVMLLRISWNLLQLLNLVLFSEEIEYYKAYEKRQKKRENDKARRNDDAEKLRRAKRNKLELEFDEMKLRKDLADDAKRHREFEVKKVRFSSF